MPWSVVHHAELAVVEAIYDGWVSAHEIAAAAQAMVRLAVAQGTCRVLADCSRLEGGHTLADLYFLARDLQRRSARMRLNEAVVMPASPSARASVAFWETTAINSGLRVRTFATRQLALAWLAETHQNPAAATPQVS